MYLLKQNKKNLKVFLRYGEVISTIIKPRGIAYILFAEKPNAAFA